jgi:hypothetical protein
MVIVVPRESTPMSAPANRSPPTAVLTTASLVPPTKSIPVPLAPLALATAVNAMRLSGSGKTMSVLTIEPDFSTQTHPSAVTIISVTDFSCIISAIGCKACAIIRLTVSALIIACHHHRQEAIEKNKKTVFLAIF